MPSQGDRPQMQTHRHTWCRVASRSLHFHIYLRKIVMHCNNPLQSQQPRLGDFIGPLTWTIKFFRENISRDSFVKQVCCFIFFHLTLSPESNDSLNTGTLFADQYHDPMKVNREPGEFSSLIRCEKSTEPRGSRRGTVGRLFHGQPLSTPPSCRPQPRTIVLLKQLQPRLSFP